MSQRTDIWLRRKRSFVLQSSEVLPPTEAPPTSTGPKVDSPPPRDHAHLLPLGGRSVAPDARAAAPRQTRAETRRVPAWHWPGTKSTETTSTRMTFADLDAAHEMRSAVDQHLKHVVQAGVEVATQRALILTEDMEQKKKS